MTPESFKSYYENTHVPFMLELAGPLFPSSHTRRYIQRVPLSTQTNDDPSSGLHFPATILNGKQEDFAFDVITEMVFDDEGGFERLSECLSRPGNQEKVYADCPNFLDVSRSPIALLDDVSSSGLKTQT
jgi:hypothetical protein